MNREKSSEIFEWACSEIMAAERQLGHSLSWRFLTTPAVTLSRGPDIAFIALNPGGDAIPPDHGRESSEIGSAYIYERWVSSKLQRQVQALFRGIAIRIGSADYESLMNNSLMAYYIPFRSPNYSKLIKPKESRRFAFALWPRLIPHISPKLILTIDRITFADLDKIFRKRLGHSCTGAQSLPTGWGTYRADVNFYAVPDSGTVVIARLPHLSRFKIFDRPASKVQVDQILDVITKPLRIESIHRISSSLQESMKRKTKRRRGVTSTLLT